MTREKEIEQAANGYLDSLFGGGKHQDLYVRLFMAGAQWADQHLKDNLVDIDKAMKVICDGCAQKAECEFNNWKTCCTKEKLIKSMEE